MTEYFIQANSFAAPFFSDESSGYVMAESPEAALDRFAHDYTHPAGLYAAVAYASADAMHKGEKPLARWLSNHAHAIESKTVGRSYSICSNGPGDFVLDGERVVVADPKAGAVR